MMVIGTLLTSPVCGESPWCMCVYVQEDGLAGASFSNEKLRTSFNMSFRLCSTDSHRLCQQLKYFTEMKLFFDINIIRKCEL